MYWLYRPSTHGRRVTHVRVQSPTFSSVRIYTCATGSGSTKCLKWVAHRQKIFLPSKTKKVITHSALVCFWPWATSGTGPSLKRGTKSNLENQRQTFWRKFNCFRQHEKHHGESITMLANAFECLQMFFNFFNLLLFFWKESETPVLFASKKDISHTLGTVTEKDTSRNALKKFLVPLAWQRDFRAVQVAFGESEWMKTVDVRDPSIKQKREETRRWCCESVNMHRLRAQICPTNENHSDSDVCTLSSYRSMASWLRERTHRWDQYVCPATMTNNDTRK